MAVCLRDGGLTSLPRDSSGAAVLARADYGARGIEGWTCLDCRVEFRSLYGILRHLAYSGDQQVVVDILDGEITRKETE